MQKGISKRDSLATSPWQAAVKGRPAIFDSPASVDSPGECDFQSIGLSLFFCAARKLLDLCLQFRSQPGHGRNRCRLSSGMEREFSETYGIGSRGAQGTDADFGLS